jgi:hypothetical protein
MIRLHDEAIRTHYAELKERALAADELLPGTPGSLVTHKVKGGLYLARAYYIESSRRVEDYLGPADDVALKEAITGRMQFADWMQQRVVQLRKLGFQVADRATARVLVELHNRGAFGAGLVLVGTLAYMARLNDLGAAFASSRTMDIDVARESRVKLAIQLKFLETLKATGLPFMEVPGLSPRTPATSAKLRGAGGLRVDVLTSGRKLGAPVAIPELAWHAQVVPFFDYLLKEPEPSAVLAGAQCIPVRIPQAGRFIWHKLYSSRNRGGQPEKAQKDHQQIVTLIAALQEEAPGELRSAYRAAPAEMRKKLASGIPSLAREFKATLPEVHEALRSLVRTSKQERQDDC